MTAFFIILIAIFILLILAYKRHQKIKNELPDEKDYVEPLVSETSNDEENEKV